MILRPFLREVLPPEVADQLWAALASLHRAQKALENTRYGRNRGEGCGEIARAWRLIDDARAALEQPGGLQREPEPEPHGARRTGGA